MKASASSGKICVLPALSDAVEVVSVVTHGFKRLADICKVC